MLYKDLQWCKSWTCAGLLLIEHGDINFLPKVYETKAYNLTFTSEKLPCWLMSHVLPYYNFGQGIDQCKKNDIQVMLSRGDLEGNSDQRGH